MKTKTLIILLVILVVLAGAGLLLKTALNSKPKQQEMGSLFLKELPVNQIAALVIQTADESILLNKQEGRWVVENHYRFPADFDKITQLIRRLIATKIGRTFPSTPDVLARLSLKDPKEANSAKEQKALRIELKDEKDLLLAGILFGKSRSGADANAYGQGQYVMLDKDTTVFLVDDDFSNIEKKAVDWLDKSLTKVDSAEIKTIRCLTLDRQKQFYAFERLEKGKDLALLGPAPVAPLKKTALQTLSQALDSLTLEEVVDPDHIAELHFSKRFDFELFNGLIYRLYPSDTCDKDRCYLKIEVAYRQPPLPEEKKTEADKSGVSQAQTLTAKTPEEWNQEAKDLNQSLSAWVYIIAKYRQEVLPPDLKGLLETSQTTNKSTSLPKKSK